MTRTKNDRRFGTKLDEVSSGEEGFVSVLFKSFDGRLRVEGESDGKQFSRYVTDQDRQIHARFFRKEITS